MGKILEAFVNDNLHVNPGSYKGNDEYKETVKTMYETAVKLESKLNGEEKELFEQFCEAREKEAHLYQVEMGIRGVRIAVLLLFEIFASGKADFICDKEGLAV